MNHDTSDADGLRLLTELERVFGAGEFRTRMMLPFADLETTLTFLKSVPSSSGEAGVRQALARHDAIEAARMTNARREPVAEAETVTIDVAIGEAMRSLGGERRIDEVRAWIIQMYGDRWKDIGTAMADLTYPPNRSTSYPPERQCLERVAKGLYKLCPGFAR